MLESILSEVKPQQDNIRLIDSKESSSVSSLLNLSAFNSVNISMKMGQFLNSGSILLSELSLELRDRILVTDNERLFNSSLAPLIYGDVITLISLSSSILPLMI